MADSPGWIVGWVGAATRIRHHNTNPTSERFDRVGLWRIADPEAACRLVVMSPPHYLSACLCFKNAASYLAEWLAFYSLLGVEHFYLYNNHSTDGCARAIAPYLDAGRATLVQYPGTGIQHDVYAHCLRAFGERTRWMMFCDDDEFLFPVADISLPEALAPYEAFAGLAVAWMLYGSGGHQTRPPGLVIENYTRRSAAPDQHVKCIVDPRRVIRPLLIGHQFECAAGNVIVNEHAEPMAGPFSARPSAAILRINHYLTKSHAEMRERRQRIQANTGLVSTLSLSHWMQLEATWNEVHDPIATRYGDRVRTALENDACADFCRTHLACADRTPRRTT